MISIRPLTREEMLKNWARVKRPEPKPEPEPLALNLRQILDLKNVIYFTFKGRPYGIPPLPVPIGEQILQRYLKIRNLGEELTEENLPAYFKPLRELPHFLWKACRPAGPLVERNGELYESRLSLRRFLKSLGLLRNPFKKATEVDLLALAGFTLGRRTSPSGVLNLRGNGNRGT